MITEMAKDLYRITVPLPENDLREVNTYLLKGERHLLVDTGFDRDECERALDDAFAELGVRRGDVDVFATHLHPDHVGLAERFMRTGSRVYCSVNDACVTVLEEFAEWSEIMRAYLRFKGDVSAEARLRAMAEGSPDVLKSTAGVDGFQNVGEGDVVRVGDRALRCIATPGHHPSHICLYEEGEKILFTGDHVLMGITPSVATYSMEQNPLRSFLESLDKVRDIDASLVLPGHRQPIDDLPGRVDELKAHHRVRLDEVLSIIGAGNRDLFSIAGHMEWSKGRMEWASMSPSMQGLAIGETVAHLSYLAHAGEIEVARDEDVFLRVV